MPVMSATELSGRRPRSSNTRQAGVAAVEFAILAIVFFTLVFSVIELARAMYVFNTMFEATRYAANAASMTNHGDTNALDRIRHRAVLRTSPGHLILGAPITDQNVRLDYLALIRREDGSLALQEIPSSSLPVCARQNREICTTNPHAANCIRFVRARICAADGDADCNAASFRGFVPLNPFTLAVPHATTVRAAQSLGSMPESTPCL